MVVRTAAEAPMSIELVCKACRQVAARHELGDAGAALPFVEALTTGDRLAAEAVGHVCAVVP